VPKKPDKPPNRLDQLHKEARAVQELLTRLLKEIGEILDRVKHVEQKKPPGPESPPESKS